MVAMPRFWIPALLLFLSHSSAGSNADKGSPNFAAAPPRSDERRDSKEQEHSQFDTSLDSFVRSLLACKDGAGVDGTTATGQLACVMAQACSISSPRRPPDDLGASRGDAGRRCRCVAVAQGSGRGESS